MREERHVPPPENVRAGYKAELVDYNRNAEDVHVHLQRVPLCRSREMGEVLQYQQYEWRERDWFGSLGFGALYFGGGFAVLTSWTLLYGLNSQPALLPKAGVAVAAAGLPFLLAHAILPSTIHSSSETMEHRERVERWVSDRSPCPGAPAEPMGGVTIDLNSNYRDTTEGVHWGGTTDAQGNINFRNVANISTLAKYCGAPNLSLSAALPNDQPVNDPPRQPWIGTLAPPPLTFSVSDSFAVSPDAISDTFVKKIAQACRGRKVDACVKEKAPDVPARCRAQCAEKGGALLCGDKKAKCVGLAGADAEAVCGQIFEKCLQETVTDPAAFKTCNDECYQQSINQLCGF